MEKDTLLINNIWKKKNIDLNIVEKLSQKKSISEIFSQLLVSRGVDEYNFEDYLNPNILLNFPDPFKLKDMKKSVDRCIEALKKNEKIGIIGDYDVDGSTSVSILFKFLNNYTTNLVCKIPNRLSEGYGPNLRIMNEMISDNVKLIFTLDCGTSAFNTIDHPSYNNIDVIVIDHHLSETKLPKVFSIINPNRFDELNEYKDFAAVGVTFLYLMALRKEIRHSRFFNKVSEPNLMSYLDLVAVGTICDIVNITEYNRSLVKKGLELIIQRRNRSISSIIDNSKINSTPTSRDIGFIVGPQINAASRIDDSSLASKLLISDNENEIDIVSKKLFLINEKRKVIEDIIYQEAITQTEKQKNDNFFVIHKKNWHQGVLGIVASKIVALYNKPTFIISFNGDIGTGSGRSIDQIDISKIMFELKNNKLIEEGGGHKMAVGIKIKLSQLVSFKKFLKDKFSNFEKKLFDKIFYYDLQISVNQINNEFLRMIEKMEPYGKGNEEPQFLVKDIIIENVKIINNKHLLLFFKNDLGIKLKGIYFNSLNTAIGEYVLKYNKYKFNFLCLIKNDNFGNNSIPQIHIRDAKLIN